MYHGTRIGGDRIEVFKPRDAYAQNDRLTIGDRSGATRSSATRSRSCTSRSCGSRIVRSPDSRRWCAGSSQDGPALPPTSSRSTKRPADRRSRTAGARPCGRQLAAGIAPPGCANPLFVSVTSHRASCCAHDLIQTSHRAVAFGGRARHAQAGATESLVMENPNTPRKCSRACASSGRALARRLRHRTFLARLSAALSRSTRSRSTHSFVRTNGKGSRPVILALDHRHGARSFMDVVAEGDGMIPTRPSSISSVANTPKAPVFASRCRPNMAIAMAATRRATQRHAEAR